MRESSTDSNEEECTDDSVFKECERRWAKTRAFGWFFLYFYPIIFLGLVLELFVQGLSVRTITYLLSVDVRSSIAVICVIVLLAPITICLALFVLCSPIAFLIGIGVACVPLANVIPQVRYRKALILCFYLVSWILTAIWFLWFSPWDLSDYR